MNKILKLMLLASACVLSQVAYAACTQSNNALDGLVGLDSSSGLVFAKTTSSANQCSCSSVRFNPSNTDTKMALTILLSAKMAD